MIPTALGFRAHSGWAVVVAVAGPANSPAVVDRRRIELIDGTIPAQPYHAAEPLEFKDAEALIERCVEKTRRLACDAVGAIIADLRKQGYQAVAAGIVLASGRPLTSLAATLASHALIHTAEGELFRDALTHASRHFHLSVTRVKERELSAEHQRRIAELGRTLGPPWRQDHKLATAVACLALSAVIR